MCSLIDRWVRDHPGRTAVVDGDVEIDYASLSARADTVAQELLARGVAHGSLVGVCVARTWELVATLLGVLRAGCAYVPLDPTYPEARMRDILDHSGAAAVVVDDRDGAALCAGTAELVWLGSVTRTPRAGVTAPAAEDLAYVIYTSGTTGRPKGVAVEHRSVVAMSRSMGVLLDETERSGVIAATSVCFDPSVMEILGTLSLGGTVVLVADALAVRRLPERTRARTVITVPSAMQALLAGDGLPSAITCVVLGGEALKRSLVEDLTSRDRPPRVINVYGPTEATVFATAADIVSAAEPVTIGEPVHTTRAYILDTGGNVVRNGVAGELYLAGGQLARGYLGDRKQTTERFVEFGSHHPIPESRLYRTGDLCRFDERGRIEFLGRVDDQVKVRGFRIELGEIESALESMEAVDRAAATVCDGPGGAQYLAAYVTCRGGSVAGRDARRHLGELLPRHLVPGVVTVVDDIPVLPNGKLDRSSLPRPDVPAAEPADRHAPESVSLPALTPAPAPASTPASGAEHSRTVSLVRREVALMLGLSGPGDVPPDVALDTLGVDSLSVVELGRRIETAVGRRMDAADLAEDATATALASRVLAAVGATENDTQADRCPPARGGDDLQRFQERIRSGYAPFPAAKAFAWSSRDKARVVGALKAMLARRGHDPHSRFVRSGSATAGTVADVHTGEERESVVWTTNLYLGLNRDETVLDASRSALECFGSGMGTSATASGTIDLHFEFEKTFADAVGMSAACLFPTGFTANLGVIAGVLGAHDAVVMDQLCHASIVDGARLSGATMRTFRHNDETDLADVLRSEVSPYRTTLVVVEGAYSMGEGTARIREVVDTARAYGALVLVDESHSFGIYGPQGAGMCAAAGCSQQVDFVMATLSKAMGSLGGVVAAGEEAIDLLKSSANAYIFQASSTPADIAGALAALRRLGSDDSLREQLWDTTAYMRTRFTAAGYDPGPGDGPIITPRIRDEEVLYLTARGLSARGVHTSAVTYPIVERGQGRLRFICSASHTREDVDVTVSALVAAHEEADEVRRTGAGGPRIPAAGAGVPAVRDHGIDDVQVWADEFCGYVNKTLTAVPGPIPQLAVSIDVPGGDDAVVVAFRDGTATVASRTPPGEAYCSLRLTDDAAIAALVANDAEGLLDSVISGACALNGHTGPFVWFVARLCERGDARHP
ncbi:amino acid adenylation domain-containing protein [Prauserella halophila]|uniref:amino acid adenylation domain-containing protein n=1 Tax=Prauserella halophila TaxID=185641 RepID=UPI0020A36ECF|nr:amino acid adenylation domain-containing protein [Prauserella halophila]